MLRVCLWNLQRLPERLALVDISREEIESKYDDDLLEDSHEDFCEEYEHFFKMCNVNEVTKLGIDFKGNDDCSIFLKVYFIRDDENEDNT